MSDSAAPSWLVGWVVGDPIWMLLAGSGGVYVLEDLADALVVARLQFGAKDVDNGCGVRLREVVHEGDVKISLAASLAASWP